MTVDNKIALVTGAGMGMGRAIALALAGEGADVVVGDINSEAVEDTSTAVRGRGRQSMAVHADMGNLDDIDRLVKETVDRFGRIDILVNNAGVTRYRYIMDVTEADWDTMHRVNAKGVFFCMQRVAQELIGQGQGVVSLTSPPSAGKGTSSTSNAAYAASKGAVLAMTYAAAHQLGRHDINVNAICPGVTLTPMSEALMAERSQQLGVTISELEEQRAARIPIGRPNDPEDIAAMAVFLAGPGARNITGQAFNVDGGLITH